MYTSKYFERAKYAFKVILLKYSSLMCFPLIYKVDRHFILDYSDYSLLTFSFTENA